MDTPGVSRIGDYIKEQRQSAQVSLRRLAQEAGVSNPYLSQIERGLRKPSAEILQQLAKALRISAEQLYIQAGLLEDTGGSLAVPTAIVSDAVLTERQKRVLLDIYDSFLAEHAGDDSGEDPAVPAATDVAKAATASTKPKTKTRSTPKKTGTTKSVRKQPTTKTRTKSAPEPTR